MPSRHVTCARLGNSKDSLKDHRQPAEARHDKVPTEHPALQRAEAGAWFRERTNSVLKPQGPAKSQSGESKEPTPGKRIVSSLTFPAKSLASKISYLTGPFSTISSSSRFAVCWLGIANGAILPVSDNSISNGSALIWNVNREVPECKPAVGNINTVLAYPSLSVGLAQYW